MKINANQLDAHLQHTLLPVYFVYGDEMLLVQESLSLIRQAAKKQGFEERESYQVDNKFSWDELLLSAGNLSLFASRKIIELHFKQGKFSSAEASAIATLLDTNTRDTLLILSMPRLESGVAKSKTFVAIDKVAATIAIWPVERAQLPQWIAQRLKHYALQANSDAIQYLADNTEGNLLATQQEIEKLYLSHDGSTITLDTMMQAISSSSRYTVFHYVDRCLSGNLAHALRTLYGLRDEAQELTLLVWSITRELRTLYRLQFSASQGLSAYQAFQQERILPMRQALYTQALQRLALAQIQHAIAQAQVIDYAIKGLDKSSPWLLLEQLTTFLCRPL